MLESAIIIIAAMVVGALAGALLVYFKVVRPLVEEMQGLAQDGIELVQWQRLHADTIRWIEIEASPRVAQAIKQRIAQRTR